MHLRIQTPTGVFLESEGVKRVVVPTQLGSFGFLPHRLDCVLPLAPGLLVYESDAERYVAIDEGFLIKRGRDVTLSVRRAIGGPLAQLKDEVEREFRARRAEDLRLREALARLESQFMRRLLEVGHEA